MTGLRDDKVGIVGSGALAMAIAGHLARAGICGLICNSRGPESLDRIVRALGPTIRAATLEQAIAPEIVILAVPWDRVPLVLDGVPDWEGRIVIDATHPPFGENADLSSEDSRLSSERITRLALGAHVVMAFNSLPATVLGAPPEEAGGRRVIFYSGDHERAKRKVATLISGMGFAAVDLGTLAMGGRLQQPPSGALAMMNLVRLPATSSFGRGRP